MGLTIHKSMIYLICDFDIVLIYAPYGTLVSDLSGLQKSSKGAL
jgi:hypothetical protein